MTDRASDLSPIVSVAELSSSLEEGRLVRLLDVRWRLGGPSAEPEYRAGHLPGAAFVPLDTELAAEDVVDRGRHPLPPLARLQASARRWGLDDGDSVVVYDNQGGLSAGRAWWLLRDAGVRDVRILDGGLAAWRAAGLPLLAGDETPEPGTITLSRGGRAVLEADEIPAFLAAGGLLLDARAGERYRGETEPIDPVAGHIPGAVSAPTTLNLNDGAFRSPAELAERFAALGAVPGRPVAVYCGSGVTAAHQAAALALAGIDAALYPGSWSEWSSAGRPVATGDDPGAGPSEFVTVPS